jgi:hypothetical protein
VERAERERAKPTGGARTATGRQRFSAGPLCSRARPGVGAVSLHSVASRYAKRHPEQVADVACVSLASVSDGRDSLCEQKPPLARRLNGARGRRERGETPASVHGRESVGVGPSRERKRASHRRTTPAATRSARPRRASLRADTPVSQQQQQDSNRPGTSAAIVVRDPQKELDSSTQSSDKSHQSRSETTARTFKAASR